MKKHLVFWTIAACPAIALAQAPAPLWDITFGKPGVNTRPYAATPDWAGGTYVAGPASGDAFISRFSSAGDLLWTEEFGTIDDHETAFGLSATLDGRVFVSGSVLYSIQLLPEDATLTLFSSSGDHLWTRSLGPPEHSDFGLAVCHDAVGGAYIGGITLGSIAAPNQGSLDIFLARYDGDGNQLWVEQFGTPAYDECNSAVPDGQGGLYIGGWTTGALGGPSHGGSDMWLARYDSSGQQLWIRQYGTAGGDAMLSLASDGQGGLLAGGSTWGPFGGPPAGNWDAFVMRLDADGQTIWTRQLGSPSYERGASVSPDGCGGAYLFGFTDGALAPMQVGEFDSFVAHYDSAGKLLWTSQFGTPLWDIARASAPDAAGGVYITGHRELPNYGEAAFLARFPGPCYANCDHSTASPALNIADFSCFLQRFAAQDPYANCDESTASPHLNIADFGCFLTKFAAGCP